MQSRFIVITKFQNTRYNSHNIFIKGVKYCREPVCYNISFLIKSSLNLFGKFFTMHSSERLYNFQKIPKEEI